MTGADHPGTHQPTPTLRYGIEAPYVPLALTLAGLASGGLATASPTSSSCTRGDITALPFPDASFDLVTSALAIHNIPDKDGRARAIAESFRVLRAGRQLVLVDIRHTDDYARWLTTLGALKIHTRNLGPRYWYGGPWTAAAVVTATRSESGRLG